MPMMYGMSRLFVVGGLGGRRDDYAWVITPFPHETET